MIISTIYDTTQKMTLSLIQRGEQYTVELFDLGKEIQRQYFSYTDSNKARDIFNELQRVYNLK